MVVRAAMLVGEIWCSCFKISTQQAGHLRLGMQQARLQVQYPYLLVCYTWTMRKCQYACLVANPVNHILQNKNIYNYQFFRGLVSAREFCLVFPNLKKSIYVPSSIYNASIKVIFYVLHCKGSYVIALQQKSEIILLSSFGKISSFGLARGTH